MISLEHGVETPADVVMVAVLLNHVGHGVDMDRGGHVDCGVLVGFDVHVGEVGHVA